MSRVPGRKSGFCLPGRVWEGDLWWPDVGNATKLSPLGFRNSFDADLGNSSGNQEGRESTSLLVVTVLGVVAGL